MFLEPHQNYISLNCRCSIKRSNRDRHFYHELDYGHLACGNLMIYFIVRILFVASQSWAKVNNFIMVSSKRSDLISLFKDMALKYGTWKT